MESVTNAYRVAVVVLMAAAGFTTASVLAADHADHSADAGTKVVQGRGVVKTVHADANAITLAHEAIPEINWPAMTMQFKVLGNAEEALNVGDEVTFELKGDGSDATITTIQKAEKTNY